MLSPELLTAPIESFSQVLEGAFLQAAAYFLPLVLWGMGGFGVYLGYRSRNRAIFWAIALYAIGLWLVRFNIWMTMLGGIAFALTLGCLISFIPRFLIGFIPRLWFFVQTGEWLPDDRNIDLW